MNIGDIVLLVGKSLKGKNRVREHGDQWEIVDVTRAGKPMGRANGDLLVEPVIQSNPQKPEMRWVRPTNDPDFEVHVHHG